jgi:hypothetical protein
MMSAFLYGEVEASGLTLCTAGSNQAHNCTSHVTPALWIRAVYLCISTVVVMKNAVFWDVRRVVL